MVSGSRIGITGIRSVTFNRKSYPGFDGSFHAAHAAVAGLHVVYVVSRYFDALVNL